ncbi:MAG TPA: peptidoglycan DD-metalloendopeptidase family protein [Candidatus Dormibacteraeota bacterium]|jgi:murein DD-endopeptidase MepM/ murein hydrolase activator NlpD|nr:peptidoglycan DD-metalloendopeptidase family protein [Candidatus Dormibacteraeota bacterium]
MGLRGTAARWLLAGGLGASLLLLTTAPGAADDITDAQARLQIINKLKGTLKDNLQKAEAQEVALQQQLQETQDTINQTLDKIAATERRIADLESQIEALDAKIAQEQLELRRTKEEYAGFARSVYKSQSDPLAQLLAAPDFQGFLNRAVAIEHLTYLSDRLIGYIHQVDLQLHAQQDAIKAKKQEADKQRADLVTQKAALVQQQAHEQDLQKKLQQSISQVTYEIKAIDTQSAQLAQKIADMEIARQDQLIAEAEQAAWQQAQFWMQNNLFNLPTAGLNHSTKYPLIWPLQQGTITLQFGPCTQAFEPPGFGYPHFHTGVDVAYNQGTPILAADDGIVVAASSSVLNGQLVGYGNYIILAHRNNFFSLYGHLLGYVVKAGDSVHQGQLIGYEGSTGNSTGPHVHFEYRYGGNPTNPLPYLPPNGPNNFNQ